MNSNVFNDMDFITAEHFYFVDNVLNLQMFQNGTLVSLSLDLNDIKVIERYDEVTKLCLVRIQNKLLTVWIMDRKQYLALIDELKLRFRFANKFFVERFVKEVNKTFFDIDSFNQLFYVAERPMPSFFLPKSSDYEICKLIVMERLTAICAVMINEIEDDIENDLKDHQPWYQYRPNNKYVALCIIQDDQSKSPKKSSTIEEEEVQNENDINVNYEYEDSNLSICEVVRSNPNRCHNIVTEKLPISSEESYVYEFVDVTESDLSSFEDDNQIPDDCDISEWTDCCRVLTFDDDDDSKEISTQAKEQFVQQEDEEEDDDSLDSFYDPGSDQDEEFVDSFYYPSSDEND